MKAVGLSRIRDQYDCLVFFMRTLCFYHKAKGDKGSDAKKGKKDKKNISNLVKAHIFFNTLFV